MFKEGAVVSFSFVGFRRSIVSISVYHLLGAQSTLTFSVCCRHHEGSVTR